MLPPGPAPAGPQVTRHDTAGLCDDITASNMAALIEVHRLELTTERTLG